MLREFTDPDAGSDAETVETADAGVPGNQVGPGKAPWLSRVLDVVFLVTTLATVLAVSWGGDGPNKGEVSDYTVVLLLVSMWWSAVGLFWSSLRILRIRRSRKGDGRWRAQLAGRRVTRLIIAGTAFIVLTSGGNIIWYKSAEDANGIAFRGICCFMVVVAWLMLQLAYTERYARLEVENTGAQAHLDFPGTERPSLIEYAYFAFTVGSTFGTSDVTVQTSRMRGIVLCHGLLAFVYNTAVLGMVLSLISG